VAGPWGRASCGGISGSVIQSKQALAC
jgi:hypothetical protein